MLPKFSKALGEFDTYIRANQGLIPNYGELWRNEETIATGFVESVVNQIVSQAVRQAAADAVDEEGGPPAATNPHPGAGRTAGGNVSELVPRFPARGTAESGLVSARIFMLSLLSTFPLLRPLLVLSRVVRSQAFRFSGEGREAKQILLLVWAGNGWSCACGLGRRKGAHQAQGVPVALKKWLAAPDSGGNLL